MLNSIILFGVFLLSFLFIILSYYFDHIKKRTFLKRPFISFIVPSYNDSDTLEKTIECIDSSYEKNKFEIFVINDGSQDNSAEILKNLKKRFNLKIITNKKNIGKTKSINNTFKKTKGEIVFIIDSDVELSKKNVTELLSRLENERVGAASCRYRPLDKGFFPRMLELDFAMMSLVQVSCNYHSTIGLWGGCIAVKRDIFEKAGLFSENMIIEDVDLAFKIGELGYIVESSPLAVNTHAPTDFKTWYKQKIRWSSGFSQTFLKHYKSFLRHPVVIFFMITYTILAISFVSSAIKNVVFIKDLYNLFEFFRSAGNSFFASAGLVKVASGVEILTVLGIFFFYPIFSLPYAFMNMKNKSEFYKVLFIFPFSIVYFPIYTVVSIQGFIIGVKKYYSLKERERGW